MIKFEDIQTRVNEAMVILFREYSVALCVFAYRNPDGSHLNVNNSLLYFSLSLHDLTLFDLH